MHFSRVCLITGPLVIAFIILFIYVIMLAFFLYEPY